MQERGRGGPAGELIGVDGGAEGLAEEGEVFAEIELGAELGDGGLAGFDDGGRRGGEQPVGQAFLAGVGAGGAEELEEGAVAEEVERIGVGVMGSGDAWAVAAVAGPNAVEAGEAALAERRQRRGR